MPSRSTSRICSRDGPTANSARRSTVWRCHQSRRALVIRLCSSTIRIVTRRLRASIHAADPTALAMLRSPPGSFSDKDAKRPTDEKLVSFQHGLSLLNQPVAASFCLRPELLRHRGPSRFQDQFSSCDRTPDALVYRARSETGRVARRTSRGSSMRAPWRLRAASRVSV